MLTFRIAEIVPLPMVSYSRDIKSQNRSKVFSRSWKFLQILRVWRRFQESLKLCYLLCYHVLLIQNRYFDRHISRSNSKLFLCVFFFFQKMTSFLGILEGVEYLLLYSFQILYSLNMYIPILTNFVELLCIL